MQAQTYQQQQRTKDKGKIPKLPKSEPGPEGEAQFKNGDLVRTQTVQRGNQAVVETRTDLLFEKVREKLVLLCYLYVTLH